jgi:ribonuclease HIII
MHVASYTPIVLRRRSSCSFDTDPAALAGLQAWLEIRGFARESGRSAHEVCRLRTRGALIVLYASGSVLVQGANVPQTMALLGQLESDHVPFIA